MKVLQWLTISIGVLLLAYFLGPKPSYPKYDAELPNLTYSFGDLSSYVANKDSNVTNLKDNNESRIVWANSNKKTPYSLVYIHGFSASPMEGDPTHLAFAKRYGMNCYIPRMSGHGLDDRNSFESLSPKDLIDDAKEALAIGHLIGEKVILMSCSTGSTLSIYLAANHPDKIHSMIMYSPNIRLVNEKADMLTKPWGLQIARYLVGGDTRKLSSLVGTEKGKYTTTEYKLEGLVAVQNLLTETMTPENFKKVKTPFMAAYYYKDEAHQDKVVSVAGIKEFGGTASTPIDQKRMIALAGAGTHVVSSQLYNKDMETLFAETYSFAEEVLGLESVEVQEAKSNVEDISSQAIELPTTISN